jgi:hypothetical protein
MKDINPLYQIFPIEKNHHNDYSIELLREIRLTFIVNLLTKFSQFTPVIYNIDQFLIT